MTPDPVTLAALERLRKCDYSRADRGHSEYLDTQTVKWLALAWTDPTPLTLDVLRAELGEPTHAEGDGRMWQLPECFVAIENNYAMIASGVHDDPERGATLMSFVRTLGQLRRLLSVIRETERSGGDADET